MTGEPATLRQPLTDGAPSERLSPPGLPEREDSKGQGDLDLLPFLQGMRSGSQPDQLFDKFIREREAWTASSLRIGPTGLVMSRMMLI